MGVEKYPHHFVNNFLIKNLHGSILFCTFANFFYIPKKKYKVGWSLLYYHLASVSPFDITKVSIIFDTTKFISYYFILFFFLIPRQLSVVGVKYYPYLCGVTFKNKYYVRFN